jgi:signal transduction histidine kinase
MTASTILIVDDELSIRIMLSRMVEPLRHTVISAENGAAALELVRLRPVDLVISDLMMPRMGGLALLESLRGEGYDCAFIILTGYGDLPQALAAREKFNISNFLVKPIHNMDQFLFDVESALSRRMLERENRQLLQRLQEINAQLEEKVRERTSELEEKNAELDRVSSFRADALKVLGHELRTPLAILSGYHALALGGGTAEVGQLTPLMGGSIARLQQIVDKALQLLSAGEATEFPLELEDVTPGGLCRTVVDRIQPFLIGRGLRIDLEQEPAVEGACHWDREKIEEVIEELLINAVRASPDGSRIRLGVRDAQGAVELTVRDDGEGIPAEQRQRIFEPFVTLRQPIHHSSGVFEFGAEGVGIGLSTARMWVELHGGSIQALDNGDRPGAALEVRLPRRAARRDEQP